MAGRGASSDGSWLILPALLLLVAGFVGPMLLFFVQTLSGPGGLAVLAGRFAAVLSTEAVSSALTTTLVIALLVTLAVLVISYPIAFYMAHRDGLRFTLVLFCIIVPYFTSIIVRTYAWMVLLGRSGLVNQTLMALGLIGEPLDLLYTQTAVVIGMVYVLLPYMVLTLFATMKSIDPSLMRAARGLGAGSLYAFRRVYLPLSLHGVISGSLIVFILAIGFFITPALMGGPTDVMIAMLIERAVEITLDWPGAAVMSLVLLALTLALYAVYYRVTDLQKMMGS